MPSLSVADQQHDRRGRSLILVDFNRSHAPELAVGEKAVLRLTEFGEDAPRTVAAVTIFYSEDPWSGGGEQLRGRAPPGREDDLPSPLAETRRPPSLEAIPTDTPTHTH